MIDTRIIISPLLLLTFFQSYPMQRNRGRLQQASKSSSAMQWRPINQKIPVDPLHTLAPGAPAPLPPNCAALFWHLKVQNPFIIEQYLLQQVHVARVYVHYTSTNDILNKNVVIGNYLKQSFSYLRDLEAQMEVTAITAQQGERPMHALIKMIGLFASISSIEKNFSGDTNHYKAFRIYEETKAVSQRIQKLLAQNS